MFFVKGTDIGRKTRDNYALLPCVDCGHRRWVQVVVSRAEPYNQRCHSCADKKRGIEMRTVR